MNLILSFFTCILVSIGISFALPIKAQENERKLSEFWESVKSEGGELFEKSVDLTSKIADRLNNILDIEIANLKKSQIESSDVDIRDKIDTVRMFVENISELKKKEAEASSFSIISKSKKDYRTDIDKVLEEIEPVLFDGEVVNYASKIRDARHQISLLNQKKVALNEDLVFAPQKGTLLKSSKNDIEHEIKRVNTLIEKSNILIDELEYDLKKKLNALGIKLSREQIRVMTTRVDGDELARSFAIFDVTKQISNTLGELVKKNSFSAQTTVKYYGTYVVLSEILGFSQREYIEKLNSIYLPAVSQIEDDIEKSIEYAEDSLKKTNTDSNRKILKNNIRSNKFSLEVVKMYRSILRGQIKNLETALDRTNEQITVAYSTYDTAANSANLVNLINETQNTFDRIMNMQIPDIIPFENTELELKFQEISDQIINVASK